STLLLASRSSGSSSPIRLPPSSTLFPYTTLFRSVHGRPEGDHLAGPADLVVDVLHPVGVLDVPVEALRVRVAAARRRHAHVVDRSEEHTSELQSHLNLVCRLLLEKKKKKSK